MFRDESLTEIVILDLGISDIYRKSERTKLIELTPAYCPPEIKFHDLSIISPTSNIFSFGMYKNCLHLKYCRLLYELITERRAWTKF